MTSTFPTSRSNSHNLRYSIRQLQHKKEALINLEAALKRRINEFRELCLKEGELTGHLPADYPLQPREPIPQVRRRITRSNGNIPNEFHSSLSGSSSNSSIIPPPSSTIRLPCQNGRVTNFALPSTLSNVQHHPMSSHSSIADNRHQQSDNLKYSMHGRSNSESVTNQLTRLHTSERLQQPSCQYDSDSRNNHVKNSYPYHQPARPPRVFQVPNPVVSNKNPTQQLIEKQGSESNINGLYVNGNVPEKRSTVKTSVETLNDDLDLLSDGIKNFQPYYEETKPFQMSDFYKYSSKHRQKSAPQQEHTESIDNVYVDNKPKTTRQLQDEIAKMKNPLKFAACDDQIQASRKLIEKSDQRLMRATAKAIASNPSLAEKLNCIASNHNNNDGRY
uniref:FERM domain-containing protein 4A n=1 Tax=Aceria tosichella TaxID=561515 RepID=A0A6G1SJ29_9ACAR